MVVQPEAVEGDSNGVDVVAIVVRLDKVGMDEKMHPQRYWGFCHPRRYWENFHPRRYWGNGGETVRTAGCGGKLMGSAGFAMALSNILARSTIACFWNLQTGKTGRQGLDW